MAQAKVYECGINVAQGIMAISMRSDLFFYDMFCSSSIDFLIS